MKLIAFMTGSDPDEKDIVKKCLSILESKNGRLYSAPTHRITDYVFDNTIVIIFGKGGFLETVTLEHIKQLKLKNVKLILLPHPKNLFDVPENTMARQATYEKLLELKDFIHTDMFMPTGIVITDKDLPEIDNRQLTMIQKLTEDKEKDSCFQVTKNGKLIEISQAQRQDSKADISVTFEELFTINTIMKVLDVDEVILESNKEGKKDANKKRIN